ncbi:MAG: uracil-DNA glycosylase [Candidatus Omnitrophica bacterium]|nr:uracil-DNA glycosylase [Candidatus Omnitrophota bacterium]
MSDLFLQLLDATIDRLQNLRERGEKYVPVSADTFAALRDAFSPAERTGTARPANRLFVAPPTVPQPVHRLDPPPTAISTPPPPASPQLEDPVAAAMSDLRGQSLACQKCPALAKARKNVVFGVGDVHAELMFVGEAPGADEDAEGEPFVGKAGQLLTRIIQAMGLTRQTVYIANILKCRPDTPGQSSGNRKPSPIEMQTCLPYLLRQIELIRPKVIVALGATAMEGLMGKSVPITRVRGHFQVFRDTPLMPTYHPAYLLRNQAMNIKRQVWEDMLQVLEKLGRPISEKQRKYFLSKE